MKSNTELVRDLTLHQSSTCILLECPVPESSGSLCQPFPQGLSETATALEEFQFVWGSSSIRYLSAIKLEWDGTETESGEASYPRRVALF